MKPISIMVAAFHTETNTNSISIGDGLTIVEAIIRAVDLDFTDEEMRNIISIYGTDTAGLIEWYIEKGIYLSEPVVLNNDKTKHGKLYI